MSCNVQELARLKLRMRAGAFTPPKMRVQVEMQPHSTAPDLEKAAKQSRSALVKQKRRPNFLVVAPCAKSGALPREIDLGSERRPKDRQGTLSD